jgi:hypothetical protein
VFVTVPALAGAAATDNVVMHPAFSPIGPGDRGIRLEFRARADEAFGHAYMAVVIASMDGTERDAGLFGFGTATGAPSGVAALFGAPGEIGYTQDDVVAAPAETYRVRIGRDTYRRIVASVRAKRRLWRSYDLLFLNCNTFMGIIAREIGLDAPGNDTLQPAEYVRLLEELNRYPRMAAGQE